MSAPRKRSKAKSPSRPLKLYWCTTPDHDEDWFIVARSAAAASREHEDDEGYEGYEGYEGGDAEAELACDVPIKMRPPVRQAKPG